MSVHTVYLKDGATKRYEARWREGERARARRFTLKGDADAFDLELRRRRQLGPVALQQLTVKGPTLSKWIAEHWGPEHASTLADKTLTRYASSYKVHIEPWLGHLALQELSVGRLRQWQAERIRAGVTADALLKAREVLSSALKHAAEAEVIQANPITLVRLPKRPQRDDVIALSPREVEEIRARLRPRDATIVSLIAYSGMRPGELRSLRWGDIGRNVINLQRAANPSGSIKQTKTKRGRRQIRILDALRDDLAAWQAITGGHGGDLVIPTHGTTRQVLTETGWGDWRSKVWTPVRRDVLDHPAVPYGLRHSFASLLLAEGRSIHYVAEQMGHDAALTLGTYGHLIAEYRDSPDIDIDDEIAKARAAVAGRPPPTVGAPRIGVHQQRLLAELAAAGDSGLMFPGRRGYNDRRAAAGLAKRGLAHVKHGVGNSRRYAITPTGATFADKLEQNQVCGPRSGRTIKEGTS